MQRARGGIDFAHFDIAAKRHRGRPDLDAHRALVIFFIDTLGDLCARHAIADPFDILQKLPRGVSAAGHRENFFYDDVHA
jgi:hypothetical protein